MAESYITRKGGGGGKLYNAYINVGGEVYEEFKYIGGTPSNHRFGYWIKNDKITGTSYFANNPITTTVNATIESNNISFLKITRMPIAQNNNLTAIATNGAKFVLANTVNLNATHFDWNWWYLNNSASSVSYYTNKGVFDTTNRIMEIQSSSLTTNTVNNLQAQTGGATIAQYVGNGFMFLPNFHSTNQQGLSRITTINLSTFTVVNTFQSPYLGPASTSALESIRGLYYLNGNYFTEGWYDFSYAQYHIWKLNSSNLTDKVLQSGAGLSQKTYIDVHNTIWKAHYPSSGGRSIVRINPNTLQNITTYYQGTSPFPKTPVTDNTNTFMYFCTTSGSYPYFRKAWISNGTALYDWSNNIGYSSDIKLDITNNFIYGVQPSTTSPNFFRINLANNQVSQFGLGGVLPSTEYAFFSGNFLYCSSVDGTNTERRITKYSLPSLSLAGTLNTNAVLGIVNFRLINYTEGNNIFGFDYTETNTAKPRIFKIDFDTDNAVYRYQMLYKGDE
jgi:hypothetical protein